MSRFYNIVVTTTPNATNTVSATISGGAALPGNSSVPNSTTWTNFDGTKAILGAQTIELDFNVVAAGIPAGQSPCWLRIWGPTKQQISQASDFTGSTIKVYGGMQNGLPLATAAQPQQGLLLQGLIQPAYGNYQGITQTLEFLIVGNGAATQSNPANLAFTCAKGQKLSEAIQTTLQAAYPTATVNVSGVQTNVVASALESSVYQTLEQFSKYIKGWSQNIIGGTYPGINIVRTGDSISVYDTTASSTVTIKEQDLIGSVTWLDAATIQFTTVMRADITVQSKVTLPALAGLQAQTTANSQAIGRDAGSFSGTWTVTYVRHVGNSREPDANAWVTTFQAVTGTATQGVDSGDDTAG